MDAAAARVPIDVESHARRAREGPCFICAMLAGELRYRHHLLYEDQHTVAFLYSLSLGSQQGNAHLHWHLAPLPPGVPYEHQQYHALMAEHGVLDVTEQQQAESAAQIRAYLGGRRSGSSLAGTASPGEPGQ